MFGSSRDSLAVCQEGLDARRQDAGFALLSGEIFAVAGVLGREGQLCSNLADSGQPPSVREGLVRQLFGGKVSDLAIDIILMTVACRWSAAAHRDGAASRLAASGSAARAVRTTP